MDLYKEIEKIVKKLKDDTRRYYDLKQQSERKNDLINASYWVGKGKATIHAVGLLEDLLNAFDDEKEQELDDMAAERSEKDCMWEAD